MKTGAQAPVFAFCFVDSSWR